MKRLSIIVIELIVVLALVFAGNNSDNLQKIYSTTSQEYEAIKYVYLLQGHSLPSTTGPWSGDELLKMITNIEAEVTDQEVRSILEGAKQGILKEHQIQTQGVDLEFSGQVALEVYGHTNTDGYARTNAANIKEKAFQGREEWQYGIQEQKPFFNVNWETWATEHFYALFQLTIQNSVHSGEDYSKELGVKPVSINVLGLQNLELDFSLFDGNFPNRAFASIGGSGWNLEIGRDRLSWGAGTTGNMTISDNLPRHEMTRFTTYSDKYKYTFLVSFFSHPMNYWKNAAGTSTSASEAGTWAADNSHYANEPIHGLRFYTAHRVEGRFFADKLTLAVTEGLMYMSDDNTIDFRALCPINFNHNNYIALNSNSTFALEADWTILKGLNIYAQLILDEFAFPGIEEGPSETNNTNPSAMGYLLGVQGAFTLKGGVFTTSLEFALTDPYLYLRDGVSSSDGYYGIDYIVAIRNWSSSSGAITYDEYPLGYTYGPDAIVGNLKAQWVSSDFSLRLGGNFFFMAHGTHDLWTHWTRIGGTKESYEANKATPTTTHTSTNNKYPNAKTVRNSIQLSFVYEVSASYAFLDCLTASLQADYIDIINYGNEKGVRQNDLQLALSLQYSF